MSFNVAHLQVAGAAAVTQVVGSVRGAYTRTVRVTNVGVAPVWLGDADVSVFGGFQLDPGDDFVHVEPDELYAVTQGPTARLVTYVHAELVALAQ